MKSLVCLTFVLAVAASLPQVPQSRLLRQAQGGASQADAAPQLSSPQASTAAAQPAPQQSAAQGATAQAPPPLGREFFGPGLNNPLAIQPNQQIINAAQNVVRANPNIRVFIDFDGQVEFTDQFGREVDVIDTFGRNVLDSAKNQVEHQQELQLEQAKFQAQQNLLRQLTGTTGTGATAQRFLPHVELDLEDLVEIRALQSLQQGRQGAGHRFFVQ